MPVIRVLEPEGLPTLRVLPQGISRKRLEQAIRELQLPVIIAHDVDEADVVMTIRSEYKQKTPMVREAEERAMPIYVLKTNTIPQMQSSLTSIFALEIDPRDAALRETEEAIGLVINRAEADRAVAAERLHPPAAAPDGRAGQPRLALPWPRAVPARPPVPGSREESLALSSNREMRPQGICNGAAGRYLFAAMAAGCTLTRARRTANAAGSRDRHRQRTSIRRGGLGGGPATQHFHPLSKSIPDRAACRLDHGRPSRLPGPPGR